MLTESVSDGAAALDTVRKLMFNLGIEACKPILAETSTEK